MSLRFMKHPGAGDVIIEEIDGEQVASVEAVGGDYMVVPIEVRSRKGDDVHFSLLVSGFGFEIGQHDVELGMSRKLSDPYLSMIPAPAKKAAAHPPRTGLITFTISNGEMLAKIPNYEGAPPTVKKFTVTDIGKLSMVLGGQVSVTLRE